MVHRNVYFVLSLCETRTLTILCLQSRHEKKVKVARRVEVKAEKEAQRVAREVVQVGPLPVAAAL